MSNLNIIDYTTTNIGETVTSELQEEQLGLEMDTWKWPSDDYSEHNVRDVCAANKL